MENQTPQQEPVTQQVDATTSSVQNAPKTHKVRNAFLIGFGLSLLLNAGAGVYYFGMNTTQKNMKETPTKNTLVSPTLSTVSPTVTSNNSNVYENTEYNFTFDLEPGERVVTCPNKNEYYDNLALWTTKYPLPADPSIECATEGPFTALFVSRKSYNNPNTVENYIENLQSPTNGYQITKTPVNISGVDGLKVVGTRDTTQPAPLPENVNKTVFTYNGVLYIIDEIYIKKNFRLVK